MPPAPHLPPLPSGGEIVTAVTVLLIGAAAAWALVVWLFARGLLRPPRMTDAKALRTLGRLTPQDLGLAYQSLRWTIRDPTAGDTLPIAAWWIPAPRRSARTVVLVHGFADAKVGALAWAPLWHDLGFNVCAIDLRAHGDSGGAVCTAGYHERHDLDQLLDRLRRDYPHATPAGVVLFGISLGATVVAATAAARDDLAAIVLDSPHADYRQAVAAHAQLLQLPGRWISGPALRVCQWLTGANFAAVAPAITIPQVRCPVLILTGEHDPFCTPAVRDRLTPHATIRVFPGVAHLMSYPSAPDAYRAAIADFLRDQSESAKEPRNTHGAMSRQ